MIKLTVKYSNYEYDKFFDNGKDYREFIALKKRTFPGCKITSFFGNRVLIVND